MNADDCPTGCGRAQPPRKVMCAPCWGEVPKHIQTEVYAAWRSWSKDFGDLDKFDRYRDARDVAIGSIR